MTSPLCSPARRRRRAFTLLEMLVAMTVMAVLFTILIQIVSRMGAISTSSRGKVSAFENARAAFTTMSRTISRANLNTYIDYVDSTPPFGNPRTAANATSFVPYQYARASELHMLSGPASVLLTAAGATGLDPTTVPGHAIFFQAPLGYTEQPATYAGMNRALNTTGFYIKYAKTDTRLLPAWLQASAPQKHRFQLMQFVDPTESIDIYTSTSQPSYNLDWIKPFIVKTPPDTTQPRARVLAEDVLLLIIRPRISPKDEAAVATQVAMAYDDTTRGSILCPNYHFDSRAWVSPSYSTFYGPDKRVYATTSPDARAKLMRNQAPPIVDLAIVCADPQTLAHFDTTSDIPPAAVQVPPGLFAESAKMEADLTTYTAQLAAANIRFRVFRTSVEILGSRWSKH